MFSIIQDLKNFTAKQKKYFESLKNFDTTLESFDLSPEYKAQGNALSNLESLNDSVEVIRKSFESSARDISVLSNEVFGSYDLFGDFIRDLKEAEIRNRKAREDFFELAKTSDLLNPADTAKLASVSGLISIKVANQYALLKKLANTLAEQGSLQDIDLEELSKSQESLNESIVELKKLQDKAKNLTKTAQSVYQNVGSVNQEIFKEANEAVSEFKKAFSAVRELNIKKAKHHLSQMRLRIDTASKIKKQSTNFGASPSLASSVYLGLVKVFSNIIKGLEFLIQPIQMFLNVGVFGLVAFAIKAIAAVHNFNQEILKTRGTRQLQYSLNVGLREDLVAAQLNKAQNEYVSLLRDTNISLEQNSTNIYKLTKDQIQQLDSMSSSIDLRRLIDESGKAIDVNQARMKLINEVITFQKGLGVESGQVVEAFDSMIDGQQFTFEKSSQALAYLSKVAATGGLNSYRLFMSFRGLQGKMSGLNTRVSSLINLISTIQKARIMNKKGEDNFLNQLQTFSSGTDTLFVDISNQLVTRNDLEEIFKSNRGGIVGNERAEAINQSLADRAIENLSKDSGTNFESAALELQNLLKSDPSAQFAYGIVKLRKLLLPQIDILKSSPEKLASFMSKNLRTIEAAAGVQFGQFGMDMLRILLNLKKSSPKPLDTIKKVTEFQKIRDINGARIDESTAAKVEAQDLKIQLFSQRQHFADMFSDIKNYLDFLFVDVNSIFTSISGKLSALFTGGLPVAQQFIKYTSLSREVDGLKRKYLSGGRTEEDRMELVDKIKELDEYRKLLFEKISKDSKLAALKPEIESRTPKITNKEVPLEDLSGLNEDQLSRYYENYAKTMSDKTYQAISSGKNKNPEIVKAAALDAYSRIPSLLKDKISSQQFVLLFSLLISSGRSKNTEQAEKILKDFLTESWSAADSVQRSSIRQKLDVFGWFKDSYYKTSGADIMQKMQINPALMKPLVDIVSSSTDPEVRKALLRGFFRAAARVPEVVNLVDQSSKNLTRQEVESVHKFERLFREESRSAAAESSSLRASISKRKQVYTYTSNYNLLGRPVSQEKSDSPEAKAPDMPSFSMPSPVNLPNPVNAITGPATRFLPNQASLSSYGYKDLVIGLYDAPTADRDLGNIVDLIVSSGFSSGEFLVADIEIDQMIYTKVDPNTNSQVILDVSRNAKEIEQEIRRVAVNKTNDFVTYYLRQNS